MKCLTLAVTLACVALALGIRQYDYKSALTKSIQFYYGQRSGNLAGTIKPLSWTVSSGLKDNPIGGWYDAGDYVKFNLPMAWSAVQHLWALIKFPQGYDAAKQTNLAKDSVKWALQYFLRCWNNQRQELTIQVGDGGADHATWGRPPNYARPSFTVSASKPGSDVAGITAAALAAGSIVFKSDAKFSNQLKTAAIQIYNFAKAHQGKYTDKVPEARFYYSSGFKDELCVASVWLKRATGSGSYLNNAKGFFDSTNPWSYSWDDNRVACSLLLFEETKSSQYKQAAINFFNSWVGGGMKYTRCGLAYRDMWGPLRYAANTAFMALVASSDGITSASGKNLNQWAVEQIRYILGDNGKSSGGRCYSYMIGFGANYPLQPHHRAASCPVDKSKPCIENNSGPSPNILQGALVGGPDDGDNYKDQRTDYTQSEVACDYNAGLQAALAGIVKLQRYNSLPATNNKCKC